MSRVQGVATFQAQPALALIGIGPDDLDVPGGRVLPD